MPYFSFEIILHGRILPRDAKIFGLPLENVQLTLREHVLDTGTKLSSLNVYHQKPVA